MWINDYTTFWDHYYKHLFLDRKLYSRNVYSYNKILNYDNCNIYFICG